MTWLLACRCIRVPCAHTMSLRVAWTWLTVCPALLVTSVRTKGPLTIWPDRAHQVTIVLRLHIVLYHVPQEHTGEKQCRSRGGEGGRHGVNRERQLVSVLTGWTPKVPHPCQLTSCFWLIPGCWMFHQRSSPQFTPYYTKISQVPKVFEAFMWC